jgi:phosphoenolpyruvate phosphomutase / 2-hydroxyethylphosphonate cytidylyltransferase
MKLKNTLRQKKTIKSKIVYVGFSADILHEGHINILKIAKNYGRVIVGLLTDSAIATYKKLPHLTYKQREVVLKNIRYVDELIPQNTLDYTENLKKIKPDYVVHGNDWKTGVQKKTRQQVLKTLRKWSGKLIEPTYTKNISSTIIKKKIYETGITPSSRLSKLKRLIDSKKLVRIMESHSALTGVIIENLVIEKNQGIEEFDGMWSSSLTDSTLRAKPDNQSVDYTTRISGLGDMLDVTTKPIIFDADNGGRVEHLPFLIKALEREGVSSVIIEDKVGLKKNSLFKNQSGVKQDTIKSFSKKISIIKKIKISSDFLLAARIESFILNKGLKDAIQRANAYSKAGADLIMIHSKEKKPNEIFQFSKIFSKSKYAKPIIAVPSTYSKTYEKDLIKNGIKIVIYANHMMRSSYPAMLNSAKTILKNQRSFEIEKNIASVNEMISLIK